MTQPTKKQRPENVEEINLTQTLRRLQLPDTTVPDLDKALERRPTALLVCRDGEVKKWGRRWLERQGFDVAVAGEAADVIRFARTPTPSVVLIEAWILDSSGRPLVETLSADSEVIAPLIALSSGSRDFDMAMKAGVADIARKPFEWRLVSQRARSLARLSTAERELEDARTSLTEALSVAEGAHQRLRSHQSFEPVTGLPNKKKFIDLLKRGMHAVERDGSVMAVFVIGFNRFRLVVEAMGQDNADAVLTEIGRKLVVCLQEMGEHQADTQGLITSAAANIDPARFAMMLTCSGDQDRLASVQQALVDRLSRPIQVAGQTVHLSVCVGVALFPQDADDADSLLQRADNAMRDAQSRGGGFKYYCAEIDAAAARKLKLEHMLHEALNASQLELAYQPIIDAATGRLSAAEALLRWKQPDGSFIKPDEFVVVAEESGLMTRIGDFVLDEACSQLRQWRDQGIRLPRMCVNVSKVQLAQGGFAQKVSRIAAQHGIEPECLELELSERGVLGGDYELVAQLHEIKDLGVRLSVDDFGTGESAIAYLRELPVDILKIDRSYVAGLPDNRKDYAIVSAMIAMGHSLDLAIVAEGVETREQQDALKDLTCDYLQGFHLSRPVDAATFTALIT